MSVGRGVELGLALCRWRVQEAGEERAEMPTRTSVLQLKVGLPMASGVPSQGQNSPLELWCDRNQ